MLMFYGGGECLRSTTAHTFNSVSPQAIEPPLCRRITVLLSASSSIRLFYKDKSCRNVSVAAAAKYDAPPEIVAATTEVRFHFAANRHGAAGRGT